MSRYATYPSLKDRVIVITGGASGIGEAMVEAFHAQGSQVIFLDIQQQAGDELVRRFVATDSPGTKPPIFHQSDVTRIGELQEILKRIADQFPAVDVLVNNAADDTRHSVEEVTPESWDQSIAVNLKHQFFMCQALLPAMQKQGAGSIINMSSIGWVIPSTGMPLYVASKAAIVGLTRTLAHEYGVHGVRINCVMPGAIETERQRRLWYTEDYRAHIMSAQSLKRMIQPDEVARLILFLASDDSAAITGQAHVVDGGWI